MEDLVKGIFAAAHERTLKDRLPYFGSVSPTDAHAVLRAAPDARLIDVRTRRNGITSAMFRTARFWSGTSIPTAGATRNFLISCGSRRPTRPRRCSFFAAADSVPTARLAWPRRQAIRRRSTSWKVRGRQGYARTARQARRLAQGRPALVQG